MAAGAAEATVLVIHAPSHRDRALALCVQYAPQHSYGSSGSLDRPAFLALLGQADAVAVVLDGEGALDAAVDWQIEKALQACRERKLPIAAMLLNPALSIQRLRGLPEVFRPGNSAGFSSALQSIRPVPARRILCFFSYSRSNREFVERLAKDLEAAGVPCWLDLEDIPAAIAWESRIAQAIEVCSHVLFVLTPQALESDHVQDELAWARERKKVVIPLIVEAGVEIPFGIHRTNGVDFTGGYEAACKRLVLGVRGSLAATA